MKQHRTGMVIEDLESRLHPSSSFLGASAAGLGGVAVVAGLGSLQHEPDKRKNRRNAAEPESDAQAPVFDLFPASSARKDEFNPADAPGVGLIEISLQNAQAAIQRQLQTIDTAVFDKSDVEAAQALFGWHELTR